MPRPALRTRTLRRVFVRTPGGRLVIHYEKRRSNPMRCGLCGAEIHGCRVWRPSELARLPKTKKRPERPYGGHLCHSCLEKLLLREIRAAAWEYLAKVEETEAKKVAKRRRRRKTKTAKGEA